MHQTCQPACQLRRQVHDYHDEMLRPADENKSGFAWMQLTVSTASALSPGEPSVRLGSHEAA